MSNDTTKTCSICGETFPATSEYFHRDRRISGGLRANCKRCALGYMHGYYRDNREQKSEYDRQYHMENREHRLEYYKKWRQDNPEKKQSSDKRWAKNNPDKKRKHRQKWYGENKDKVRRAARRRYHKDPERFRNKYRRWYKNNPHKIRELCENYRARKRNAEGSHTAAELNQQFKRQKSKCYYCGDKLDKNDYHADHVIPLSKGGSNYISNIVCACPTCNLSKHDKLPHEWEGSGGRLL